MGAGPQSRSALAVLSLRGSGRHPQTPPLVARIPTCLQSGSPVPVAPIVKEQHSALQGQIETGGVVDETQAQTGLHGRAVHGLTSIQAAAYFTLQTEGSLPAPALVDHLQHGPRSRRFPVNLVNPLERVDSQAGHESIQTKCQLILAGPGQKGAKPHGPHSEFGIEDAGQSRVHEIDGAASGAPRSPKG